MVTASRNAQLSYLMNENQLITLLWTPANMEKADLWGLTMIQQEHQEKTLNVSLEKNTAVYPIW